MTAFLPLSADARYHQLAFGACETLIQREERFAKTAVGWILHGFSRHDKARVSRFVEEHIRHFSSEALKNALKHYDKVEQAAYLNLL